MEYNPEIDEFVWRPDETPDDVLPPEPEPPPPQGPTPQADIPVWDRAWDNPEDVNRMMELARQSPQWEELGQDSDYAQFGYYPNVGVPTSPTRGGETVSGGTMHAVMAEMRQRSLNHPAYDLPDLVDPMLELANLMNALNQESIREKGVPLPPEVYDDWVRRFQSDWETPRFGLPENLRGRTYQSFDPFIAQKDVIPQAPREPWYYTPPRQPRQPVYSPYLSGRTFGRTRALGI